MGQTTFATSIVSDSSSWINSHIPCLQEALQQRGHAVRWVHDVRDIPEGDFVFYLGCGQIAKPDILQRNRHNLIVHESALPQGKGWSPLTWQILEGKREIPITLFEAADSVDSGAIYLQDTMTFAGDELVDELRQAQADASIRLCLAFVDDYPKTAEQAREQQGESTFYPRRTAQDSELDPDKTIREQLNLLRVVDNERYPAFFTIGDTTYVLKIEKKRPDEKR